MWGTFDLIGFKIILGLFGACLKWPITRKWLVIETNGLKFML